MPTSVLEQLTLDGLDLNSSAFIVQGLKIAPPPKRLALVRGADDDGGIPRDDPHVDVRTVEVRLRVAQQATMDAALAQLNAIQKKLESCEDFSGGLPMVWQPALATRPMTLYVLSGEIVDLPISLDGNESGWYIRAPSFTVRLTCKPFLYGPAQTFAAGSSSTPFLTLLLAGIQGDVPAEGRLIVTDTASKDRAYLEWGMEQRFLNQATSLLVDSDDMVTSGYGGTQTTGPTGAYDPNASGNNAIAMLPATFPQTICATPALAHVGTFRVKARVAVNNVVLSTVAADPSLVRFRLAWQDGDSDWRYNGWAQVPSAVYMESEWAEIDLGLIDVRPAVSGNQQWIGRIETYTEQLTAGPGTDTVWVDYLVLVPVREGYGRVRAYATPTVAATTYTARDTFDQAANPNLTGQTASVGGSWVDSGIGSGTDFTVDSTLHVAKRTATGDSVGRHVHIGSAQPSDVGVAVDVQTSGTSIGWSAGVFARMGSDFFHRILAILYDLNAGNGTYVFQVKAEFTTVGYGSTALTIGQVAAPSPINSPVRVGLIALANGVVLGFLNGVEVIRTFVPQAVTGGTIATGFAGMTDIYSSGAALTRTFDNFAVWTPEYQRAIYSGRAAEVRYDGNQRQDSTGVYYGFGDSYRGSRFLVPPAGDKARTSRVLVKAHRTDIEAGNSANVTDALQAQAIVTPRWSAVPEPYIDLGSYANMWGWWDFSALALANNAGISSIADGSGNGRTLTQATGSLQPLFKTNVQNGLPMALFDGSDDGLFGAATANPTAALTIFAVFKAVSVTDFAFVFGHVNPASWTAPYASMAVRVRDATNNYEGWVEDGSNIAANYAQSGSSLRDTSAHLLCLVYDQTNVLLYRDDMATPIGAKARTGALTSRPTYLPAIGSHVAPGTEVLNGYAGEVAVYGDAKNAAERQTIGAKLRLKWGI